MKEIDEFYKNQLKEIDKYYRKGVLAISLAVAITILYIIIMPVLVGIWSLPGLLLLVPAVCKFVIDPIIK